MRAPSRGIKPVVRLNCEALEDRLTPATLLALTDANTLLRFDSASPLTATTTNITGLNTGEQVLGIDFRPANGLLYGVTDANRIVTIDATTGVATPGATLAADPSDTSDPFTTAMLTGILAVGLDFNPVVDRLRLVTDTDVNLRINVDTGAVITDGTLAFPATGDTNSGDNPYVVAAAYAGNFAGSTTTTLYDLNYNNPTTTNDNANNALVDQTPANGGTLNTRGSVSTGSLKVPLNTGFDILTRGGGGTATRTDTAYAALNSFVNTRTLYTINLATGQATIAGGRIGDGTANIRELAVVPAGTLNFSAATYSVNENGGTATITVTRTGGSLGAVTVQYATSNGTATAGQDYTATTGTLNFADGVTSQTFTVPIINDQATEPDETVLLSLTNATGDAVIGAIDTATLTIRDDETNPPGTLNFGAATYSVGENGGTATITVTRTGGTLGAITVDYATADGSATAGQDYTATTGTLSFADGETSKTFAVPILDDSTVENDETLTVTLSNPTGGASIGTQATTTVTITDNDVAPSPTTPPAATGYVDRLFRSILGRPADPTGLRDFNAQLAAGVPRATVVASIVNSPEGRTTAINALYRQYLGRDVDQPAVDSYLNTGATLAQVTTTIIGSQEYFGRNGGTTDGFLSAAFQGLLGRPIDPTGRAAFTAALQAGATRDQVALAILTSQEGATRVVNLAFNRFLRRDAGAGALASFVPFFQSTQSIEGVIVGIASSEEYFQRTT